MFLSPSSFARGEVAGEVTIDYWSIGEKKFVCEHHHTRQPYQVSRFRRADISLVER